MTYLTAGSSEAVNQILNRSVLVATSSDGRFVSMWARTIGNDLMVQTSTSTDGVTWTSPVTISEAGNNSYRSEISVTPDGRFVALWRMLVNGDEIVYLSHSTDGVTWSTPTALSGSGYNSTNPTVASDSSGRTIVAWDMDDGVNEQLEVVTTTDFNQWSTPTRIPLSTGAERDNLPEITASSENGFAMVFYSHTSDYTQRVAVISSADGITWTSPSFLTGQNSDGYWPLVETSSTGDFLSLWVQNGALYSSISTANNTWSSPLSISSNGCSSREPAMSTSNDGTVAVIWVCSNNPVWSIETSTTNNGSQWTPVDEIYTSSNRVQFPQVSLGQLGEQSAAWNLQINQDYSIVAIARPIGEAWGSAQTVSSPGSIALSAVTATNNRGVLLTLWDEAITADWQVPPLYWQVASSVFSYEIPVTPISPDQSPSAETLAATGSSDTSMLSYGVFLLVLGASLVILGRLRKNSTT